MSMKILQPGLLTAIQDLGRYGYQKEGVIVSGAMDRYAARYANLLVGNPEHYGVIEMTLLGPTVEFQQDCLISLTGGDLSPKINKQTVTMWKPIFVKKGSILDFGAPVKGCRAYLAAAGGFQIKKVLGSYSTYIKAGMGGFKGRAFKEHDEIPLAAHPDKIEEFLGKMNIKEEDAFKEAAWFTEPPYEIQHDGAYLVRVMEGRESGWFTEESRNAFWEGTYKLTSQSDRMGFRLEGAELQARFKKDMLSEAVAFGTIQVPANGQPIVLMADHQTTGGYPKFAQVLTVDLPILAQMKPGEKVKFIKADLAEAEKAFLEREDHIKKVQYWVKKKLDGAV
ncbi:biotin-dependent carboxyltransferase family protein [Metabacillus sp. GX 13764]|uniref:5-oxoprolinase subunit C family protein n=1 Tax=Metabacillus kandeliae TaxID=2900151 RepID=UPI001E3B3F63|nr:biotin-dependent carboxyltransferase family protein [Metabacillus kandeliae]MCD7032767.1 biotin-dependent carboxyltransferase family protein [Metabacillus kandeliae]